MQGIEHASNREITAVLFDMDNTLFDFVEAKIAACTAVNHLLGIDRSMDLLTYFLRNDARDFEDWRHIRDFMKDHYVYSEKQYAACCRRYEDVKLQHVSPYPHTHATLQLLKDRGVSLNIVTDAHRENAFRRLEKTNLSHFFDHVICADMTHVHKPDPRVFVVALQQIGRSPAEVVMVGDSLRRDIGPAREVGMMTAYARYGDRNFDEERTARADVILADIRDIVKMLDECSPMGRQHPREASQGMGEGAALKNPHGNEQEMNISGGIE